MSPLPTWTTVPLVPHYPAPPVIPTANSYAHISITSCVMYTTKLPVKCTNQNLPNIGHEEDLTRIYGKLVIGDATTTRPGTNAIKCFQSVAECLPPVWLGVW